MVTAPREVTPPPIQAPTAKEKKYDRQLRLWAASGQRALEESHILLIIGEDAFGSNSSVAGVETLKNLILPGIGRYTIADAAEVQESDLGINFFLNEADLNKPRAEGMRWCLQELNPDVQGHSIVEPASQWIPRPDSMKPYNLIVLCAPIQQDILDTIYACASQSSTPIIYIQSVGFYSSFSVQLPTEFPVVETHPDPDSTTDLRLLAPWPELSAELDALGDLSTYPDHDHGHIPYILILLHYLKQWYDEHKSYPGTFKEKTQFRDLVRSSQRTNNPEGGEENFDEACAAVLKTIALPPIGSGCKDMFAMPSCAHFTADSANFWLIAHAIKTFYDEHSVLPLPGSLPDMKATSAGYIKLQNIYKSKARKDVTEVTATVRALEKSLSRKNEIPAAEIESFCKNASHVRVLTNPNNAPIPSLRLQKSDAKILSILKSQLENDWEDMLPIFIALNASSIKDATSLTDDVEKQAAILKCVAEVERMNGGELHNISSLTGGMVAQEAVKLLTRQYVPVDGTAVYDGIRGKVATFKL
jgi:NEDD8-activating enzyme E1 regulatory subunit